jgi:hypothetical protein
MFKACVLFCVLVAVITATPLSQQSDSSTECLICKFVAKFAIDAENQAQTEPELEAQLLNYCDDIPGGVFEGPCEDLVKTYVPQIWDYLNKTGDDADADQLCQYIDLCYDNTIDHRRPVQFIGSCSVCEQLGKVAIDVFEDITTEAQLKSKLDNFCEGLPSVIVVPCTNLVDKDVAKIFAYLTAKGDKASAQELCHFIDLCPAVPTTTTPVKITTTAATTVGPATTTLVPATTTVAPATTTLVPATSTVLPQTSSPNKLLQRMNQRRPARFVDSCSVCELFGKVAIDVFEDVTTEAQLKSKLDKFCSTLISIIRGSCTKLVDQEVAKIFSYLTAYGDDATAQELCYFLDLCDAVPTTTTTVQVTSTPVTPTPLPTQTSTSATVRTTVAPARTTVAPARTTVAPVTSTVAGPTGPTGPTVSPTL